MRAARDVRHVDASIVIVQLLIASIAGLILMSSLLARPALAAPPGTQNTFAVGWLAVGLLISAWLVVLAPSCVRLIAAPVAMLHQRFQAQVPTIAGDEAHSFARWLVAFGEILLIQAILRPPLVTLLSGSLSRTNAEGLVAGLTLAVLLLVLVWVHRSARPLVATATRSTLDIFLASTDSDTTVLATAAPATTLHRRSHVTGEYATRPAEPLEATVPADAAAVTVPDVPTETLLASGGATIADPNATRLGRIEDGDKTLGG